MSKNKGARVLLTVLCVVLGLVLAGMIAGTVYFQMLVGKIGRVEDTDETYSDEQIQEILKEEEPEENTAPELKDEDVDWGEDEGQVIEKSENIVNILLIGQDTRQSGVRARSDSMILVTFNIEENTITMTSFLRDLYVKIPGYSDNKLNATYVFGGMELLNQTLEQNFGVQVDGNVEVDFSRFAEVIELLGGVDIELRHDEAMYINAKLASEGISSSLTAGMQTLNGNQALWYSRIRYLDADADFSRTNRQRKVVNSLIEKFRDTKLTTLMGLLDELLPMIATDMSNSEILGYAKDLFPMLADCTIVSQRIPADNTYTQRSIDGMSCIVADMDAARKLLEETIGG
jgi:LCP family protein required for cell wall assembly